MQPIPRLLSILSISALSHLANAIPLDVTNTASIINASATLAYGVQSYYHSNVSGADPNALGVFSSPYYWWESGAVWGSMVDYWAYTKDESYVSVAQQGLLAQVGPDDNFLPPYYMTSEGNDDQAFWAFSAMTAAEYDFPVPSSNASSTWLDLVENVWDGEIQRWNTSTCNGGMKWQIYPSNSGYDYKNSIANAGLFQISARLARHTNNQTYVDWAEKTWDWLTAIGLVDSDYNVYDGTNDLINCSQIDHDTWSYNPSALLYGAANLYNLTDGSSVWAERANGLVGSINRTFVSPFPNATNILSETFCELQNNCDTDQFSFKAYTSRWLAKSAVLMPSLAPLVQPILQASASAAAQSCSGGDNGQACGTKWYVGEYDGTTGLGQELSAMATVQALLLLQNPIAPFGQTG